MPRADVMYRAALLLMLAVLGTCESRGEPQKGIAEETCSEPNKVDTSQPLVCIIIRTYWAHGKHGDMNLQKILKGFQDQSHSK
jgi:hypothetical protein